MYLNYPYQYEWSDVNGVITGESTSSISSLSAGDYSVTVIDENGCNESIPITLTGPEPISIDATNSVLDNAYSGYGVSTTGATDGYVIITVDGGVEQYSYNWIYDGTTINSGTFLDGETLSFDNLAEGAYTLQGTDANGCDIFYQVTLNAPGPFEVTETHSDYNGYGVECNNVICTRKVYPEHLLAMIQSHFIEGSWRAIDTISELSEVNIHETYIGEDRRLRLRPLIKNYLTLNDIFREIYSEHWMRFLGVVKVQESFHCNIGDLLLMDYDCSNIIDLSRQIEVKSCALNDIEKLASRGICLADKITSLCSEKISTQITRIKSLSGEIELLDKRINQVGLIHPEVKPITDMFAKRKENFKGNDPIQLSQETRKCYQMLHEEGKSLGGLLASVSKELKAAHVDTFHAAVSSMSVEVPGR